MKKLLYLMLAVVLVLSMVGCGSKASPDGTAKPDVGTDSGTDVGTDAGTDEPVTIKVANYALLEKGYTEFWEGAKEGFEAENPNVTIEWVTAPYGEILSQVMNMAGAGDKVDLIFSEIIWVPSLVDAGLAEPMENVLDQEFLDDFYPNILDAHKVDDTVYSVPLYASPSVLFYNKNLFEKAGLDPNTPPTTYDEMLAMAEKLSELKTDDGNKVYAFGQPTASVPVVGASLTAFAANFGGYVFDENGEFNVDNEGFIQAMDMLKVLDEKGYNPQNVKPKDLRNLFALEQLAMYYDNSWGFNGISAINPDAVNFTETAMPLKGGNGEGESTLQSNNFVAINNGDARLAATGDFIKYVLSREILEDYVINITPGFTGRKSMEDVVNPVLEGSQDAISIAISTKLFPTINDLNLELCSLAQSITVGKTDVKTAIENFKPSAEAILR